MDDTRRNFTRIAGALGLAVKGAFVGLAVDGSVLDVRQSLNTAYYGREVTPADILVKRVVSNPGAKGLQHALVVASK